MSDAVNPRYPIWCRGDLDGFFGLMVDNLVQVLLIIDLCKFVAGLPDELIFERILPAVALSLLVGNIFYGLQARWVARRHGNTNCTALPYGINTPTVIAHVFFIMGPVYKLTGDPNLAWLAGVIACLVSGIIEFCGAFLAEWLRRVTPRAALLGVLAAVGITFIAADFAFRIFTSPLVGILPLALLMLAYFAQYRFPWRLPGGFIAVLLGSLIAWGTTLIGGDWFGSVAMSTSDLARSASSDTVRWIAPTFAGQQILDLIQNHPQLVYLYLTVSIPMAIINVLGSLQNIESAEAGGDRFATAPSLAVNGLGSLAAGLFGSAFPTTIYIGHPGWKALGARAGYSIVNGIFFTAIFLFGLGPFLRALIPIEAGAAIVVYIGIIITAQAFQATPKAHAPAVAVAIFPGLAAILVVTLGLYFDAIGQTLIDVIQNPLPTTQYLPGLLTLAGANSGWIVVTLILASIGASLIDHKYKAAAIWAAAGTMLTLIGAVHAYRLEYTDGRNVVREYFIWQQVDATHLHAPPPNIATADTTSTTTDSRPQSRPTTAISPTAEPNVIAYRAFPIAVGYALATIVFALAAWHQRRAEPRAGPA